MEEKSASQQIDDIIKKQVDWRGQKLLQLRRVIRETSPTIIEEVKWKKPSKPEGVPVWASNGTICVGDVLKNAVRLTFPHGAEISDEQHLFNARLDNKTARAIDFAENDTVDMAALSKLITEAMHLNETK